MVGVWELSFRSLRDDRRLLAVLLDLEELEPIRICRGRGEDF